MSGVILAVFHQQGIVIALGRKFLIRDHFVNIRIAASRFYIKIQKATEMGVVSNMLLISFELQRRMVGQYRDNINDSWGPPELVES